MRMTENRAFMRSLVRGIGFAAWILASPVVIAQEGAPKAEPAPKPEQALVKEQVPKQDQAAEQDQAPKQGQALKPDQASKQKQDQASKQKQALKQEPVVRQRVTGSNILRPTTAGTGSPVLVLDGAYIDQSGATTAPELIGTVPQAQVLGNTAPAPSGRR
jgi:hypothetical protein